MMTSFHNQTPHYVNFRSVWAVSACSSTVRLRVDHVFEKACYLWLANFRLIGIVGEPQ
ncbi:hypothetical protein [uncultured Paenibacillus sp.]|uniref:hypothetical protein n=1 Tax=uncultured Paenibacillus sp. TaxID=227322 RepID=UPI0025976745|nr:hypothetical protein [uncultured Paenibacillus sp.]